MNNLGLLGMWLVAVGSFIVGLELADQGQPLVPVIACPVIAVGGVLIRAGWD